MATTLQINLTPTDLLHLIHILPHQLRQFGGQVDEMLLTVDLHQSRGRFGTDGKNVYLVFLILFKYSRRFIRRYAFNDLRKKNSKKHVWPIGGSRES
jgi:hypothetical protein